MTSLAVKRQFNELYVKFLDNKATIQDVSDLIVLVRYNKSKLTDNQIKEILEIPQSVLEEDVVLKKYSGLETSYFINNRFKDSNYKEIDSIGQRFLTGDVDAYTFAEIIEFCRNNTSDVKKEMEFYLRNPEVALRDDVIKVNRQEKFEQDQNLFASILKKSLDL